ncbi:unnamed protein product [Caenorhabditis bovis]|uniref:Ig-like domain-containing protein n=1 Tax=Caenorhabditis bovis TaxID=2654633 RepID=A0A8S1EUV9_9PELO|nr:unnamed protein product [Caenorhabditis bovis]
MSRQFCHQLFLFQLCTITVSTVSWVKITKPNLIWEELSVNSDGERLFHCGEFDSTFTGRYHWRFNGSSILPERTQIHRNRFVFLRGANAIRNSLTGEYECCVRETLGNACYSRQLIVRDKSSTQNVDLSNIDRLEAEFGNTYYLRLADVKRVEGVKCTLNGRPYENFKYPFIATNSKKSVAYHVKIDNLDARFKFASTARNSRQRRRSMPHFWQRF